MTAHLRSKRNGLNETKPAVCWRERVSFTKGTDLTPIIRSHYPRVGRPLEAISGQSPPARIEVTPEILTDRSRGSEMQGTCSKCGQLQDLAPSNISRRTGQRMYRSWCLPCEKKRKDEWRGLNKAKHNEKCRVWAKENPEKRKSVAKKWNVENKNSMLEAKRLWRKNNLERARSHVNARRKAMRVATPKCLDELEQLWIQEIYHLAQICKLTVDHVIPLRHKMVCGLHVPWNLQLLDASSNYSKSNTFEGVATR